MSSVATTEAARSGDVVVVAIPQRAVADLPKDLFANLPDDVVVIDTAIRRPLLIRDVGPFRDGRELSKLIPPQSGTAQKRSRRFTFMMKERLDSRGNAGARVSRSSLYTMNSSLPGRYSQRRRMLAVTALRPELY